MFERSTFSSTCSSVVCIEIWPLEIKPPSLRILMMSSSRGLAVFALV